MALLHATWSCQLCGAELERSDDLLAHVSGVHLDYFPFTCGVCCLHFASELQARQHVAVKKHLPAHVSPAVFVQNCALTLW